MPDDKKLDRDVAILDAVYHEAGLEAGDNAKNEPRTPERQAKLDAMMARAQAAVQSTREQALADAQEGDPTPQAIPQRILSMTRDAILARLRELIEGTPALEPALQFRDLDDLSTADLQRLLADIELQLADNAD